MTKSGKTRGDPPVLFVHSDFGIPSSFVISVSSFCLPVECQTIVVVWARLSGERLREFVQTIAQPFCITSGRTFQSEPPHLHRDQTRSGQFAVARVEFDQIHQRQIAAEHFATANSFIVGQEISTSIKNEATLEDFDCFHVMRGVSVHDCNAFFNQAMSKGDLFPWNFVSPITSPMNRSDNQIARLLMCAHLFGHSLGGDLCKIIEQIYSRGNAGGPPILRDPTGP